MSDSYGTASPSGSDVQSSDSSGKVDAFKQEAADVKDTVASQAKDVLDTAKTEASGVVGEARMQAKDLYAQTQRELKDQANTQQQRIASGLRVVGDEFRSMASNSDGSGVASDLVQQVSARLSSAATWLGDRDPSAVLGEVKRYARRRPGAFILGAAVVGIVAGRLTRALASNASNDDAPGTGTHGLPPAPAPAPQLVESDPSKATRVGASSTGGAGSPLYDQTVSGRTSQEDGYDRPHTV